MEVDIEEDENKPELTYPYEEVDPLNPPPPAFESESKDAIEVENSIEHEDETVPASVHEVVESFTTLFLRDDNDGLFPGLMRRDINSLFGRMASLSRRLCGRETTHALVEKKGKAKDKYYGLILDLGNEVRVYEVQSLLSFSWFNELALLYPRMVETERVKVDAYIRGLTNNIKGEVTSSKTANLNEAMCMAHKLMEQKSQARDEIILQGKKITKKQGTTREPMVTAPTDGKLPLMYCKEKNVATGVNALPILTCYDCGEQGHTRNRCPRKVKQEEVREVRGRAYSINDAKKPKDPND
ncbi:putative reverse transcriptase domain-containing protein [Tanacetum coccineum]